MNDWPGAIEEAKVLLKNGDVEPDSPIGLLAMINSPLVDDREFAFNTLTAGIPEEQGNKLRKELPKMTFRKRYVWMPDNRYGVPNPYYIK